MKLPLLGPILLLFILSLLAIMLKKRPKALGGP
jgi:hypothetical protein